MRLSAKRIQQKALVRNRSRSKIDFLKSEEVAKIVADKVLAYLRQHYPATRKVKDDKLVKMQPSVLHTGTWEVLLSWQGVPLPDRLHNGYGRRRNHRRADAAVEVLQQAYQNDDLVTSWPLPPG